MSEGKPITREKKCTDGAILIDPQGDIAKAIKGDMILGFSIALISAATFLSLEHEKRE